MTRLEDRQNLLRDIGEDVAAPDRISEARFVWICSDGVFIITDKGVGIEYKSRRLTPGVAAVA